MNITLNSYSKLLGHPKNFCHFVSFILLEYMGNIGRENIRKLLQNIRKIFVKWSWDYVKLSWEMIIHYHGNLMRSFLLISARYFVCLKRFLRLSIIILQSFRRSFLSIIHYIHYIHFHRSSSKNSLKKGIIYHISNKQKVFKLFLWTLVNLYLFVELFFSTL